MSQIFFSEQKFSWKKNSWKIEEQKAVRRDTTHPSKGSPQKKKQVKVCHFWWNLKSGTPIHPYGTKSHFYFSYFTAPLKGSHNTRWTVKLTWSYFWAPRDTAVQSVDQTAVLCGINSGAGRRWWELWEFTWTLPWGIFYLPPPEAFPLFKILHKTCSQVEVWWFLPAKVWWFSPRTGSHLPSGEGR